MAKDSTENNTIKKEGNSFNFPSRPQRENINPEELIKTVNSGSSIGKAVFFEYLGRAEAKVTNKNSAKAIKLYNLSIVGILFLKDVKLNKNKLEFVFDTELALPNVGILKTDKETGEPTGELQDGKTTVQQEIEEFLSLTKDKDVKPFLREVITILQKLEPDKTKTGTFKYAGHLIDQTLKSNYPDKRRAPLFDYLETRTKDKIQKANVEITEIVEGIKLSPSEKKIVDSLAKLLSEKSQTEDSQKDNYYTGIGEEYMNYGGEEVTIPKLASTLYEITKEYKGGGSFSGKDVENVKQILKALDTKRFLLKYIEETKNKNGTKKQRKIEEYKPIIRIIKISETDYSRENAIINEKEEIVIHLSPIFRRQIETKFILYPNDIIKRTQIAYGNDKVSDITMRLRDYLIREVSSKRYKPQIGLDRLYYTLAEKWMEEGRKKMVKEYTEKAIETAIALGILIDYEIMEGATGETKIVFNLNKDWA
jgi:hypothetical protein